MAAVNDYKDEEMISSVICQMQSAKIFEATSPKVRFQVIKNLLFGFTDTFFRTAENSLIGHNLTRHVWRVKFKDRFTRYFRISLIQL